MSLPNPGMDFTAFDTLPAASLDDLVENIESLAAGTGLNDSTITAAKIVNDAVTAAKIDWASTGANGGIWSEELGRTTLVAAGNVLSVTGLPARKYITVIIQARATGGTINSNTTFNGDTAGNYARALSNGGIYSTSGSLTNINWNNTSAQNIYIELKIFNVSTIEKGVRASITEMNTAGAANAPISLYGSGKWANTSAVISSVTVTNTGTGNYAIGSEIIVLGHN